MNRPARSARLILAATAIVATAGAACPAGEIFDDEFAAFAAAVDRRTLKRLPVQHKSRITIMDTFARDAVHGICGDASPDGVDPAVAWMELYLNASRYLAVPLLYVKEDLMRSFLLKRDLGPFTDDFRETHRLPPAVLIDREGLGILARDGRLSGTHAGDFQHIRELDLGPAIGAMYGDRTGEYKVPIDRLMGRFNRFLAADAVRVIPAAGVNWKTPFDAIESGDRAAGEAVESETGPDFRLSPLLQSWVDLQRAWTRRDAEAANASLREFARRQAAADTRGAIPSPAVRTLEIWFNRTGKFAIAWVGFAIALILIIAAAATNNLLARRSGLTVLGAATALLAAGFIIRWILSGRAWYLPPLMNQFEAVMGSALLAGAGGFLIELFHKRNYIALGGAFYATVALLSCQFFSRLMGADISNPAGILNSMWMAAHVAVIVVGHAFVGMSLILSVIYLFVRLRTRGNPGGRRSSGPDLCAAPPRSTAATVDRCNLIVAQVACWSVTVGTILGAVWADVAWGRFWGWDPKETWALITALLFIILLHLRFVVPDRRRGLATAAVCILGCGAMLFNWIIVNYFLEGMHSYA